MNPQTAGAGASQLQLLQGLRLKGRATTEQLAHFWGIDATRSATLPEALVESYHGIWFEFHEELIQASGRTRAQESSTGGGA